MAAVVITLEVDDKAGAKIGSVTGTLKGLGSQAKETQSVMTGVFQGIGEAAFSALEEIPKLFAEMGVAAAEFVASCVEGLAHAVHAIEDFVAKTGVSVKAAQELSGAMKIAGGDSDALAGMINKMQKALVAGSGAFKAMGLDSKALKNEDVGKAFADVAERIKAIQNPTEQAAAMLAVFGKGGAEAARLIKEGVVELSAEAEKLGGVLSDKDVASVAKLSQESRELGIAWDGVKNQFAAALLQSPLLQEALESLVKGMSDLADWVVKNRGAIALLVDILIGVGNSAVTGFKQLYEWAGKAAEKMKAFIDAVPGLRSALKVAQDIGTQLGMANAQGSGLSSSSRYIPPGGGQTFTFDPTADALAKTHEQVMKLIYDSDLRAKKDVDRQLEQEYKANVVIVKQTLDEWAQDEKDDADARKASTEQVLKYREAFVKSWEAQNAEQLKKNHEYLMQSLADMKAFGDAISNIGDTFGNSFLSSIGAAVSGFADFNAQAAQATTLTEKLTVSVNALASAYSAGEKSASPGKGALAGAAKGAGAGAAFGPWGMVIGGVIGGIAGFLGGKKGESDELKGLQDQFAPLMAAAQKAGIVFQHAFDTKNATALKAAIVEVQKALDTNAEAQKDLNDAVQRYGFTVDQLGPVMAKQKLDEQAGQLYQDWQLLNAAGIDHTAIVEKMGPAVSDYVNSAKAAGQDIPIAMKPIIDAMLAQGTLLDANGVAYTDAKSAGITYAESMSQMFTDLITKVGELVDALNGIKPKTIPVNVQVNDPQNLLGGGGNGGGDGRERNQGYAVGYFNPGMSSDRWMKVHQGERVKVTPAAESAGLRGSGGGGQGGGHTITVNVTVQGDGDANKIRDVVQRGLKTGFIKVPA